MNVYESIQALRVQGYSKRRAAKELTLDKRTVGKYWEMSELSYSRYITESSERAKILDPYRKFIAVTIENDSVIRVSIATKSKSHKGSRILSLNFLSRIGCIVKLIEEHSEINSAVIDGKPRMEYEDFEPSYRSVRLYVANLRDELGLPTPVQIRQYCEVEELPPGRQAQVDMGQKELLDPFGRKVRIYIFCMSLSCSRYKFCCFGDKAYNAEDFVKAHDLAFKFFGGRTEEIVYDQDRVMTVSENAGDLILTDAFEDYSKYAGFKIHLCRGYDPESKGKIEAVVKYVKKNFLVARTYYGLDNLNSDGLKWLERVANAKVHDTTKMVPARVFLEEKSSLIAVPELSEPGQPNVAAVRKTNVVHYKQNRYEVPKGSYRPGRQVLIEPDYEAGTLRISDTETGQTLAEHKILFDAKGKKVSLPRNAERYKETKFDDLKAKILESFTGNGQISGFLERIRLNYHRYTRDQYSIILKAIKTYSKEEIAIALNYCVEHDLYSATYFREALIYFRGEEPLLKTATLTPLPEKYGSVIAEERGFTAYDSLLKGGGAA